MCTVVANHINRQPEQLVNIIDDNILYVNLPQQLLWQQDLEEEPLIFLE